MCWLQSAIILQGVVSTNMWYDTCMYHAFYFLNNHLLCVHKIDCGIPDKHYDKKHEHFTMFTIYKVDQIETLSHNVYMAIAAGLLANNLWKNF
jgi:hypothetical protein